MLKSTRKTRVIKLPSGPNATVASLVGRHQRILTETKRKMNDKLNELLADVLIEVEGVDFSTMQDYQKVKFVESMLSADRRYILTEARQLAQGRKPTFEYIHEWKDEKGVKQESHYEVSLIDQDNRESIISSIQKGYGDEFAEIIKELNQVGSFPTKPYRNQCKDYKEVLESAEIVFDGVPGYPDNEFIFRMFDGKLEKSVGNSTKESLSSHTKITSRLLRYKPNGGESWISVTTTDLDGMELDALEYIRAKIDYFEGDVDTVETMDNPDETSMEKEIRIDIIGQISFFFPSGRV